MEARSVRLQDLDFDRKQLKVVQGKAKTDTFHFRNTWFGDSKNTSKPKNLRIIFEQPLLEQVVILTIAIHNAACNGRLNKWQSSRNNQRSSHHTLRHSYATHLLEDAWISWRSRPLGHPNVETTMEYLHIAQLESQRIFSPLDTLCTMQSEVADVL
jgi:integrase